VPARRSGDGSGTSRWTWKAARSSPADVQDREVSKVFADGGTGGSTRRDRLKELMLPDLLEIVGQSKETEGFTVIPRRRVVARSLESSLAWVQRAACRFLMRRIARGTRA